MAGEVAEPERKPEPYYDDDDPLRLPMCTARCRWLGHGDEPGEHVCYVEMGDVVGGGLLAADGPLCVPQIKADYAELVQLRAGVEGK